MSGTLWGRASSVNVQKVMWALAEIGRPYTRIDAGIHYGQTDTEAFAAMNPTRRVPVWQDDAVTLWESHAIVRYLAAPPLHHSPVADQWMEFSGTTLQPAFISIFWQVVRMRPEQRSPETFAAQTKALNAALAILDGQLATNEWLAGPAFSTADIAAGSLMYRIHDIDWPMEPVPNVAAWYDRLQARPHYAATVMTSYDELRP